MMSCRKWLAGAVAVAALALVAGGVRSVMAQEPAKPGGAQAGKDAKEKFDKAKDEHLKNIKKAVDASKTSLVQAIQNAEKEMKGKTFEANIRATKEGKPLIHVNMFVGEEVVRTLVDPDTGKVTKNDNKEGPEGGN
jgi:hypothetical protein